MEVGWHLRFVQADEVDIWAEPKQASVFEDLAATFPAWRFSREEIEGAVRFRFKR